MEFRANYSKLSFKIRTVSCNQALCNVTNSRMFKNSMNNNLLFQSFCYLPVKCCKNTSMIETRSRGKCEVISLLQAAS